MPCHDREILSRYQDGALDASESRRIAAHLDSCASCRETLASLGRAGLYLRIAVGSHKAAECLSEEELGAYLAGVMRAEDRERVERHLANCRHCMHEAAVLSDDAMAAPAADSPAPDAKALERFRRLAPASTRRGRAPISVMPWLRRIAAAAAAIALAAGGWYYFGNHRATVDTPVPPAADGRLLRYVTEVSYGTTEALAAPAGSVELARFAHDAGALLREVERVNEKPTRDAFELVQDDILNSGLVETVARLREFTREERDRRFLNDCEYVLMQVVKTDASASDFPDGDLTRIVSEIRRLKLAETARLVEMEGSRSQWLAGL